MRDENIIELRPDKTTELLEKLLDLAKEGKLKKFIFCGTSDNDEIISGSCNTSINEEQSIISYLQLNVFKKLMSCNEDNLADK